MHRDEYRDEDDQAYGRVLIGEERFQVETMEKYRDVLQRYECTDRDTIDGTVCDQGEGQFEKDAILLHRCSIVEKSDHQKDMHRRETKCKPPSVQTE